VLVFSFLFYFLKFNFCIHSFLKFWGFAHSLANILNMELPSREAINYQFYNSLSRPQSADEFDARLKAVDSIQEK